ncbi:MAG: putative ABC transport system permease protein [Gammaproteobacteria bacterium]|jgi:putative ABC transport system permease protein
MNNSILTIPVINLSLAFTPVLVVLIILFRWSLNSRTALYAVIRMLTQLILIGYALSYIFAIERPAIVILVLIVMLTASSFISFRTITNKNPTAFFTLFASITVGGITTVLFMTGVVLELDPWFLPQYLIPLAGMIIANCMNTVSLAAERFESELRNNTAYDDARRIALNTSLIPTINSLLAVGLVSLPGMMTGQILSGVDPLIAVRYQIIVMCMVFGSSGISSACYLILQKSGKTILDANE